VLREALAAVLALALGAFFLAAPAAVVRAYTAGRGPSGRRGDYGTDGAPPATWQHLVRGVGVLLLAGGAFFAWQVIAAL
jgi:hypothetical protein